MLRVELGYMPAEVAPVRGAALVDAGPGGAGQGRVEHLNHVPLGADGVVWHQVRVILLAGNGVPAGLLNLVLGLWAVVLPVHNDALHAPSSKDAPVRAMVDREIPRPPLLSCYHNVVRGYHSMTSSAFLVLLMGNPPSTWARKGCGTSRTMGLFSTVRIVASGSSLD